METVRFEGECGNSLVADRFGVSGPPVMLLHGAGQTRHAFRRTAKAIAAAGFTAFNIDQRGHGESQWVAGGAYSFHDFGKDATRIATTLAARSARLPLLVGASLGGIAGLLVEDAAPEPMLSAIVLVDVTPSLDQGGLARIRAFMSARLADGFASVEEAGEAVALYMPGRARPTSLDGLRRNLREGADGRLRWHWDPAIVEGPSSIVSPGGSVASALQRSAAGLRIPALLVRGSRSELVTAAEVEEFRRLAPMADYVDVEGAGHMVAGDRNDAFCNAIVDFIVRKVGALKDVEGRI